MTDAYFDGAVLPVLERIAAALERLSQPRFVVNTYPTPLPGVPAADPWPGGTPTQCTGGPRT